jgi:hypothetical protein
MIAEYFSLTITPSGTLVTLPLLLRNYLPNPGKLPSFLRRLGRNVPPLCLTRLTVGGLVRRETLFRIISKRISTFLYTRTGPCEGRGRRRREERVCFTDGGDDVVSGVEDKIYCC